MISNDYDKILKEHFDLYDDETRKVMLAVNEDDKSNVLMSLTSKLYDNIVQKVDDIDFGTIPKSMGDITEIENYQQLVDCISVIDKLLVEFKQDQTPTNIIKDAITNIKVRKDTFEKSFKYKIELPMVLYSTIVLSIVSSVSLLITTCIEYIKTPNSDNFELHIDRVAVKQSKNNLLFKNLNKFNISCKKGDIDSCLDYVIKKNIKQLTGLDLGVVLGSVAAMTMVLSIIPILRELIFFFYYTRTKVSDYFELQADLLQMNTYNLKNNEAIPNKNKKDTIKKQTKIAEFMRKISNKLAIDQKKAEKEADKDIAVGGKKYKINDVVDSIPDSASSAIF